MSIIKSTKNGDGPRLFRANSDRPMTLLGKCPVYHPTPLFEQTQLSAILDISRLSIKDESQRMRLGSFKALGGAFAVAQMICDAAQTSDIESETARLAASKMTFTTASAGNHGLSVAAGARIFGSHAAIFLSASVPESFADRIRALDAEVIRVDGSYEDSVAEAIKAAKTNDWLLLADGSWDGYIDRPALVMEGYTVLAEECKTTFSGTKSWPTHVFLQAGVGGLAAAVAGHIRDHWEEQPKIVVVEPETAPCLFESVKAGRLTRVEGPQSNMGRLDCKDASLIAFMSLRKDADIFMTISEADALAAVDLLATAKIETTSSGAATIAAISKLQPGQDTHCLAIVTEGPEKG